jgi:hypothetical protein
VVVAVLALGVLAAALVKLAGSSGSTTTPVATSAAGPASVTSPGTATPPPASSAATPPAASNATTPVAAAPVSLGAVTMLAVGVVRLNGAVNPLGAPTTYQFQYGATTSYGGLAPDPPVALGAGTVAIGVNANIRTTPGTTYHYKLTASRAGHKISTGDATFTAPQAHAPPGATSAPPEKTGASR